MKSLAAGLVLCLSATAHAEGCKTPASVTADLWKKYGAIASAGAAGAGPVGAAAVATVQTIDKMIKFWNEMSGNSWAKIGPRRLDFDGNNKGTVESIGDRAWISAHPATGAVEVEFKKLDGNGKATVDVCKVDERNKTTLVKTFEIDKDDKDGKSWSVSIPDAKGHIIAVTIDGKSVTRKVQYAFTARAK